MTPKIALVSREVHPFIGGGIAPIVRATSQVLADAAEVTLDHDGRPPRAPRRARRARGRPVPGRARRLRRGAARGPRRTSTTGCTPTATASSRRCSRPTRTVGRTCRVPGLPRRGLRHDAGQADRASRRCATRRSPCARTRPPSSWRCSTATSRPTSRPGPCGRWSATACVTPTCCSGPAATCSAPTSATTARMRSRPPSGSPTPSSCRPRTPAGRSRPEGRRSAAAPVPRAHGAAQGRPEPRPRAAVDGVRGWSLDLVGGDTHTGPLGISMRGQLALMASEEGRDPPARRGAARRGRPGDRRGRRGRRPVAVGVLAERRARGVPARPAGHRHARRRPRATSCARASAAGWPRDTSVHAPARSSSTRWPATRSRCGRSPVRAGRAGCSSELTDPGDDPRPLPRRCSGSGRRAAAAGAAARRRWSPSSSRTTGWTPTWRTRPLGRRPDPPAGRDRRRQRRVDRARRTACSRTSSSATGSASVHPAQPRPRRRAQLRRRARARALRPPARRRRRPATPSSSSAAVAALERDPGSPTSAPGRATSTRTGGRSTAPTPATRRSATGLRWPRTRTSRGSATALIRRHLFDQGFALQRRSSRATRTGSSTCELRRAGHLGDDHPASRCSRTGSAGRRCCAPPVPCGWERLRGEVAALLAEGAMRWTPPSA